MYRQIIERHRRHFSEGSFRMAALVSALLFVVTAVGDVYAGIYATARASNSVTDIILSNTPTIDVDGLFVYGTFLFIAFSLFLLILHPNFIPFTLSSFALFFFWRAVFVSLTHIGPISPATGSDFGAVVNKYFFGDDFFFSGHAGSPFLLSLIFWDKIILRYVLFVMSGFFAVVVLLGHLHYSIDVLAAFFITYVVYIMALRFFQEEYLRTISEGKQT